MTYKELANKILSMSDEHQNMDVSVYCYNCDDFYSALKIVTADDPKDSLHFGSPYVILES